MELSQECLRSRMFTCSDDNHRASRCRRTALAADTEPAARERRRTRSRSSSIVGRPATRRISARRKSERDIPARAACAFSARCRLSGTLRIWMIRDMCQAWTHVRHMSLIEPTHRLQIKVRCEEWWALVDDLRTLSVPVLGLAAL